MSPRPYTLVAELTYKCPLRCPYCSNPVDWAGRRAGVDTDTWCRAFGEAEELGVVQLNLTGGEPLLRRDLEMLVARARALDLYTNLITSGLPLDEDRLGRLAEAGLDALQLSVQDAEAAGNDAIAGTPSFEAKLVVARRARELGLPLTLNVVLHRANIDQVPAFIALAERLGAERLELANTQYLGWALVNRAALLPSRAQIEQARAEAAAARERLAGRMELLFVTPDYWTDRPRRCMDGWGSGFIVIAPDGAVMPCHAAGSIPGLRFDDIRQRSLADIWHHSEAFRAFRGTDWMGEPCRSCARREIDLGGCRCQAMALAGDVRATDPVCPLSPHHHLVQAAREEADAADAASIPFRHRAASAS